MITKKNFQNLNDFLAAFDRGDIIYIKPNEALPGDMVNARISGPHPPSPRLWSVFVEIFDNQVIRVFKDEEKV